MHTFGRLTVAVLLAATMAAAGPDRSEAAATTTAASAATVVAQANACAVSAPTGDYVDQVSLSPGHARVWRLYQAFYLRQPDSAGFDYWVSQRNGGADLSAIAFQFAYAPEFVSRYGNLDNGAFVDLVYANVLCRVPDSAGRVYWTGLLSSGAVSRWDLMVNFVELREYLARTGTCHSIYRAEAAAVSGCPEAVSTPLAHADLATDGYAPYAADWPGGSIQGVVADLDRPVFETGSERCRVASINANWLVPAEKDRANPAVLGLGVVDGVHVKGSADRTDRGVFGLRFDAAPHTVVEVQLNESPEPHDRRLNSVIVHQGHKTIESWHAAAEASPYLTHLRPQHVVDADRWVWAAAGVPLIIGGQLDPDFSRAYHADPYTYQTHRHTFVAVDTDGRRLVFGGTSSLTTLDLVNWAQSGGFEELIKFDGGASAEFNVGGQAVVAGTNRDIPVWFGVGC